MVAHVRIGPWPAGEDGYHRVDPTHAVYQSGVENVQPRLLHAVNVLLDSQGYPDGRAGLTELESATAGKGVFSGAGLLLFQDGGTIYTYDPDTTTYTARVTGLSASARVVFHEHLNQVLWSNGIAVGRILSDGTATNWGCDAAPQPTLGTTAGALPEGRYLVAVSFVDGNGLEHAAGEADAVTTNGSEAITVAVSPVDSNATHAKIFCTDCNGPDLFRSQKVAVGALPATISALPTSNEQPKTQFNSPPIPCDGIFSYRARAMIFVDSFVYPSRAGAFHLFPFTEVVEQRPTNVIAGAGLASGFWTLCEDGAYWTEGLRMKEWQTWKRDGDRKYAAGSLVVPGYLLPILQTQAQVALFVSSDGLVAGLPDGSLTPLTFERMRLDVEGKRARIGVLNSGGERYIVFSLE